MNHDYFGIITNYYLEYLNSLVTVQLLIYCLIAYIIS